MNTQIDAHLKRQQKLEEDNLSLNGNGFSRNTSINRSNSSLDKSTNVSFNNSLINNSLVNGSLGNSINKSINRSMDKSLNKLNNKPILKQQLSNGHHKVAAANGQLLNGLCNNDLNPMINNPILINNQKNIINHHYPYPQNGSNSNLVFNAE